MGTAITRQIFNKADHRNIRLLEQADGARCVDQREILGRRYDDRARWLVLLNHRKLHVPGAGRQVHDEDVHIVPFGVHKRSEEHTSELQSLMRISYAVFCLKKNKTYPTQ